MKICYFFSNIYLGETTGQTSIALSLIQKTQECGYRVYIVSNYENQPKKLDRVRAEKFLIKGPSTLKTYLLNIHKIIKYLKTIKPDVIHVQGHLLIPYVYFLNKLIGSKIIYLLPERIDYFNKFLRGLIVFCIKNIGIGFVISEWNKKKLVQLGVPVDRILVAHIGLRDSFLTKKERRQNYKYDIFYYGDASRERGFDVLYHLAKSLPQLKFKLLIRWKKDEKKNLKELESLENVSIDYPYLNGPKLKQLILKSKIVVLPYRWMGVQPPITLLESMALGKCVLTSSLPGTEDFIIDNKNTILLNPDSPLKKIIGKIEFLLNNPEVIKKIGQNANKAILKYYTPSEYKKIFSTYEMIERNFYEWRMFGDIGSYFISAREINTILDLLQPEAGDNILDVGTGSGRFARAIVKNSKAEVTGVDPDRKILEEGKLLKKIFLSKEEEKRYKCFFGNGENIKFKDGIFNKAFSFRALKYYPNPYKGISELCRILNKNGILILEVTSNQSWESFFNPLISRIFKKKENLHFWEKKMINFNPRLVKQFLSKQKMLLLSEKALHKIPPFIYFKIKNERVNYLLNIIDKILLKVTPKYLFSKSIVFKCKKL